MDHGQSISHPPSIRPACVTSLLNHEETPEPLVAITSDLGVVNAATNHGRDQAPLGDGNGYRIRPARKLASTQLTVELPRSTLVNPRSVAWGYEPPCQSVSEYTALDLLHRAHL